MNMRRPSFCRRALLLLLSLLLPLLAVSCQTEGRTYDAEEVLCAARSLLPAAEMLNDIYYGEGIRPVESEENKAYLPAREEDLLKFGITNLESLRQRTKEIFSASYASLLERTKLSAVYDGGTAVSVARYYQSYTYEGETKIEGDLMVYTSPEINLKDTLIYHYEEITVDGSEGSLVYVTLPVTATDQEGLSATVTLRVGLIEEADGWRIDTPTYARYPIYDQYD